MDKKLGSNPLDSLKEEGKEDLNYLNPKKIMVPKGVGNTKSKEADIMETGKPCIHLRTNRNACFCYSPQSRQHGFLGKKEEAEDKCRKCYVKVLK